MRELSRCEHFFPKDLLDSMLVRHDDERFRCDSMNSCSEPNRGLLDSNNNKEQKITKAETETDRNFLFQLTLVAFCRALDKVAKALTRIGSICNDVLEREERIKDTHRKRDMKRYMRACMMEQNISNTHSQMKYAMTKSQHGDINERKKE